MSYDSFGTYQMTARRTIEQRASDLLVHFINRGLLADAHDPVETGRRRDEIRHFLTQALVLTWNDALEEIGREAKTPDEAKRARSQKL